MTQDESYKPSVNQFKGCILGCALGDVVGAWAERKPTSSAQSYVLKSVRPFQFKKQLHHGGLPFGVYTDDTQLTRELALSIIEEKRFVPEAFANRVAQIFLRDGVVGGGKSTQEAAIRLLDGCLWHEAGTPAPAAGNGGAMRAAPIGLLHWKNIDPLLEDAANQARITHQAESAVAASVAVAAAVAMCLNASRDTSHPGELGWWNWLSRIVGKNHADFGQDIQTLTKMVFSGRLENKAQDAITGEVLSWLQKEDDPKWEGISPWARTTVLWCLYCVMVHPRDVWEAIALAIWPGGDTDSTAAITGAIVGAHIGIDKFPPQVLREVAPFVHDDRAENWRWNDLEQLAVQLHEIATQPQEVPEGVSLTLE